MEESRVGGEVVRRKRIVHEPLSFRIEDIDAEIEGRVVYLLR